MVSLARIALLSSAKMPSGAALRPWAGSGPNAVARWHDERMVTLVRIALRLIEDALRWVVLLFRSTESVHAENLFLRRQLALYIERGVQQITRNIRRKVLHDSSWAGVSGSQESRSASAREWLDHLAIEGRDVVGLAARHEVAVDDDLLVCPRRAGVAQVGLQRRPARHPPALGVARLEHGPRPVADRSDRLAGDG
jgi:hypothetical protein